MRLLRKRLIERPIDDGYNDGFAEAIAGVTSVSLVIGVGGEEVYTTSGFNGVEGVEVRKRHMTIYFNPPKEGV